MYTIHEKTTYNSILTLHEMMSRTLNKRRHIILVIIGLIFCGWGVRCLILAKTSARIILSVLEFLFGLYYIFHVYIEAYFVWAKYKENPFESCYEFNGDSFTYRQGSMKSSTDYSKISKLYRGGDAVFLVVDEHVVHYLDCCELDSGNTDELCAFLQEKTGKEIGKA